MLIVFSQHHAEMLHELELVDTVTGGVQNASQGIKGCIQLFRKADLKIVELIHCTIFLKAFSLWNIILSHSEKF